ncbi:restriction endonuclease subunit S [Kocuria rhizophila]|uniref:restriction endonuclease subunit S n=1 Tax=Kocuria rhizophila TaxID=72000 RepID=UPI0034DAD143
MTQNLDYLRIPLNASERADRKGDVPYWGANGVVDHVNEPLVDRHVVLIGEDGAPFLDPLKPVAFAVDEPIWPNNHIHVLDVGPDNDPQFIAYALNSVDYSLHIKGSTRDKLNQSALSSIEIPVPDFSAQKIIGLIRIQGVVGV